MKLTRNLLHSAQKGFTLIELLIVIAVLGVLAAAVLAALNPIEQINRGQDASREDVVGQLGRAVLNYQTAQQQLDFSTLNTAAANWQATLVASNELKQVISITPTSVECNSNTPLSGNPGYGLCFATANANADALVWTVLSSQSEKTRAGCTATQVAVAVWDSSQGRAGVGCVTDAGTSPVPGIKIK